MMNQRSNSILKTSITKLNCLRTLWHLAFIVLHYFIIIKYNTHTISSTLYYIFAWTSMWYQRTLILSIQVLISVAINELITCSDLTASYNYSACMFIKYITWKKKKSSHYCNSPIMIDLLDRIWYVHIS